MTPEQFDALENWISDMIHSNASLRESYLKARALLVEQPAKEIQSGIIMHDRNCATQKQMFAACDCKPKNRILPLHNPECSWVRTGGRHTCDCETF